MRAAIISDIHSNLPALEAVLDDIDEIGADEIWCLGDIVGYGADPNDCTTLIRERTAHSLIGNHDLAVLGNIDATTFSAHAAFAVAWTKEVCSYETLEFLSGLGPSSERDGVGLFHASPRDPVWEYVLSFEQATECLEMQPEPVCMIGHSHVALHFTGPDVDGQVKGAQALAGTELDLSHGRWLINPGSVGQPRDGDPRAAWLEFDDDGWKSTHHRVKYDIDAASDAIIAAGLPAHLAERLHMGH